MITAIVLLKHADWEHSLQIALALVIISAILMGSTFEITASVVAALLFLVTKKHRIPVSKPVKSKALEHLEYCSVGPIRVSDYKKAKGVRAVPWKSQGVCNPSTLATAAINDQSLGVVDAESRRRKQITALADELDIDDRARDIVLELPSLEALKLLRNCKDKISSLRNPSAYVFIQAREENRNPSAYVCMNAREEKKKEHQARRLLGEYYEEQLLGEMRKVWHDE